MSYEWNSIQDRDTVLHEAAFQGDLERLRSELERNKHSNVNARNRLGCTPLRLAATAGHSECVRHLLWHGASVDIADIKAQTPLFVAIKNRHIDCVRALLEAGANPDGNQSSLCSPAYIAAMDGFADGISELLKYGANPDISQLRLGYFNSTPVYISVAYHHLECFRLLLLAGADPNGGSNIRSTELYSASAQTAYPSLYHATVKHNVEVEYVMLLYDCGASLYRRDGRGLLPCEIDANNECSRYIRQLMPEPRSLLSSCRIIIRRCLGRRRLKLIDRLSLPSKLCKYLSHSI